MTFVKNMDPQPTHIMVFANTVKKGPGKVEELINLVIFSMLFRNRIDTLILKKWINRYDQFNVLLNQQKNSSICATAVIWTDGELKAICTDRKKVQVTALHSETWWRNLLKT